MDELARNEEQEKAAQHKTFSTSNVMDTYNCGARIAWLEGETLPRKHYNFLWDFYKERIAEIEGLLADVRKAATSLTLGSAPRPQQIY